MRASLCNNIPAESDKTHGRADHGDDIRHEKKAKISIFENIQYHNLSLNNLTGKHSPDCENRNKTGNFFNRYLEIILNQKNQNITTGITYTLSKPVFTVFSLYSK